jgi:germination protein M
MRRRFLIAAVLLGAFVLAFSVSGCGGGSKNVAKPSNLAAETTETTVFYATGRSLVQEPKVVNAKDVYNQTMQEWLKADPQLNTGIAVVQPQTKILSVTVKDGVATIDFDKSVLDFKATAPEKMLAYAAILETMGQFPEINKVQFTVEGKSSGTIGGKDVKAFWGDVSLNKQPWPALRPPKPAK